MDGQAFNFQPAISKACSRCRARKVKCDLQVPQCAACKRQNEQCDISQFVAYPYAAIVSLQERISHLQYRLDEATRTHTAPASVAVSPALDPRSSGAGQGGADIQTWADEIRKDADEVGILAIGGTPKLSESQYMGSAAGSTFARIFFKLLNLTPPSSSSQPPSHSAVPDLTESNAALPPRHIARILFHSYLSRIHVYWPFVQLPSLRRTFRRIYEDPRTCSSHDKFLVFVVLALSSAECSENDAYVAAMDMNDAQGYFRTSLRFFLDFHDSARDLPGLQAVVLLTIWMLNSCIRRLHRDLWHLTRYAMSVAIELGLHRHNDDWGFSAEELEIRNRTWWCIYNLERQVALVTGRVLSIRDHAIRALQPMPSRMDSLQGLEEHAAPLFHTHGVKILNYMIRLRQIGGRVLESVYISRGPDGKTLFTSFQEICTQFDAIHRDLEVWKREFDLLNIKRSRESSEMEIEYCLILLVLNRPSPTFMIPSHQMAATCSRAVSSAVRQWVKLKAEHGASAIGRSFRTLHDILMVGLAALYCDWQSANAPSGDSTLDPGTLYRHSNDTAICVELMEHCIDQMKDPDMMKYRDLLRAVRMSVYGPASRQRAPTGTDLLPAPSDPPSVSPLNLPEETSLDGTQELWLFSENRGMEDYMDQVVDFFNRDMADMDGALTDWYSSVIGEIQPQMPNQSNFL